MAGTILVQIKSSESKVVAGQVQKYPGVTNFRDPINWKLDWPRLDSDFVTLGANKSRLVPFSVLLKYNKCILLGSRKFLSMVNYCS